MRYEIVSIVAYAVQSASCWEEYLDARQLNDVFGYEARDIEDSYDLGARDFDDSYLYPRDINYLASGDLDNNYISRRDFDEYTYHPLHTREISFPEFQTRDIFSPDWYRPTNPSNPLSIFSSPSHRDHPHILFQNNHAFLLPPQGHSLFDTFLPPLTFPSSHSSHSAIMTHASVSNSGSGYCSSSTIIGIDGIPHTTKHCSNTTPDSHMSITVGPVSSSDDEFFADPFADLFVETGSDPHSHWHDGLFGDWHATPKLMRNKRILDIDAAPQRGTIHSSESEGEHDHDEHEHEHEHEHHSEEHESEKHELRDGDSHDHDSEHEHGSSEKEKRDANPEAEEEILVDAE